MKILNTYPETLSNREIYALTTSPKTRKMKDAKGTVLEVAAWAIYTDADKDGNERTVLSILTPEGESYATNSNTFIADFGKMVDVFGPGDLSAVEVCSGVSKNGREYITCAYAGK